MRVLHSQSHAVSNASGIWALAPSAIEHVEYVLPLLGPPTALTETAKSNYSNADLQMNVLSQPPISSHSSFSGDHTHYNVKYLEKFFFGDRRSHPDVLALRAYDAALDAPVSITVTKPR
jgi:hypothetical protein